MLLTISRKGYDIGADLCLGQKSSHKIIIQIHEDDISSLLILNKNKEAQVFQAELNKFKDHQTRIASNLKGQAILLQEVTKEIGKMIQSSQTMKVLEMECLKVATRKNMINVSSFQVLEAREKRKYEVLKEWKRGFDAWKEARGELNRLLSS